MSPPTPEAPELTLLSVNVGMPQDVPWQGRIVRTGIWKYPTHGPRRARRLNLDGDGQGDTAGHGGEQRAVMVYQAASYRYWQQHLQRDDLEYGQFGENLTVDGLPDDEVCIGDRYRIGDAEFEVTQPRVTCYRVGMRLGVPEMPALLIAHHRPGFYMRVLHEGDIEAGDRIVKTRDGPEALAVAEADALLYLPGRDPAELRRATRIPALSPGWRSSFSELLAGVEEAGPAPDVPAWAGFRRLRVSDVVPETTTVSSIHLVAPDGTALPAARAGQYLTVRVTGTDRPAAVRSYSISSAPGSAAYRISVKHEPGGAVSGYLTGAVRPGDLLEVAAPRGEFVLRDGTDPILLLSAGIGVTPELARRAPPRPGARLLEPGDRRGTPRRARPARPGHQGRPDRPRRPEERGRLPLRARLLHQRRRTGPHRGRPRPRPGPHRAVRGPGLAPPRPRRADPTAPPTAGAGRDGAAGHLRPQRRRHGVPRLRAQRARTGRGL